MRLTHLYLSPYPQNRSEPVEVPYPSWFFEGWEYVTQ